MWSRSPYTLTSYVLHNQGHRADPQPYDVAVLERFASEIMREARKDKSQVVICEKEYKTCRAAIAVTMTSSFGYTRKAMDYIDYYIGREDFRIKILRDCVLRFMVEERYIRTVFFLNHGKDRFVRFDGVRIEDGTGMPVGTFEAAEVARELLGYEPDIPLDT